MIKHVTNPSKSFHLLDNKDLQTILIKTRDEKKSLNSKVSLKRLGCLMLSNFCSSFIGHITDFPPFPEE